jgi:iron complex outermembrane receptor protein
VKPSTGCWLLYAMAFASVWRGGVELTVRDVAAAPPQDGASRKGSRRGAAASSETPATDDETRRSRRTVVVPTRARGPTSGSVRVTNPQLATTPRRTADDLLRLVPGLFVVQHGNQGKGPQLFLRGFDAAHGSDVEMRIDGIRINEPSNVHGHGYLDTGLLIPEVVDTIDVTKGSFVQEQGAFATAGSVDWRLGVRGAERGTRLGYELGSTNRHRLVAVVAPTDRPTGDFVAFEAVSDDGFGARRSAQRLAALGRTTLWSRSGRDGEQRLDLLMGAHGARFDSSGTVRRDDVRADRIAWDGAYVDTSGGASLRGLLALRYRLRRGAVAFESTAWASLRRLTIDENFTGFLIDPTFGDRTRQAHSSFSTGVNDTVVVAVLPRMEWVSGLDVGVHVLSQSEARLDTQGASLGLNRDLSGLQVDVSPTTGIRWLPTSWFGLRAGVRGDVLVLRASDRALDRRGTGAGFMPSPRVAATFRPHTTLRLDLAYGRGLRPPEARAVVGRPALAEGETSDRYLGGAPRFTTTDALEVGGAWFPIERLTLNVTGFATFLQRESVFDHVSGSNVELGATRRLGVEAGVSGQPVPWLDMGVDFAFSDARFVRSGVFVPGAPRTYVQTRITIVHPAGLRVGMRWAVLGPRPLAFGAVADAWTNLSASIGWRWTHAQLDLAGDNLLGLRYAEGEYAFASIWGRGPDSQLPARHVVAGLPFTVRASFTVFF